VGGGATRPPLVLFGVVLFGVVLFGVVLFGVVLFGLLLLGVLFGVVQEWPWGAGCRA
jgi:hypothetical protein